MHLSVRPNRHRRSRISSAVALAVVGATTVVATQAFATSAAAPPAAVSNGVEVRVDLSERRLVIVDRGQAIREFGVAIGKPSHPTPTGQFTLRKMIWNPRWVPPKNREWARGKKARDPGDPANPMQSVKIFFREPYYYIHGTNDPKSIGEAASHGCIRMTPEDAAELGAYLMEHGGQPREESWFRRVFRLGRSTVLYLDRPIPLTITA